MNTARWPEVERLFQLALEQEKGDRRAFLAAACSGDAALRAEVEALLEADAGDVPLLDEAVAAGEIRRVEEGRLAIEPGDQLGPYTVQRLIGEGGMGAVYLAERDDEHFRRPVAIKVLKQALFSPAALGRFHNECRVLARLEHPYVARLYDAGTTEGGLPYMVMEYLEGVPIDEAAREMTLREKVSLVAKVCDAVASAHQRLIVHRDLKPDNILVTSDGAPKLLDFGIAKLLDSAAPSHTVLPPMTPSYASPEQLSGGPVTTSTDVYSLGLLLFELLTGELVEPEERQRDVPPLASGRVSDRRMQRLRGDLDAILRKAMAVDPEQRYSSVERFADDLRRHLDGLPVSAQRSTWAYRLSRFARRHVWEVAAAVLVMLLLSGFAVAMSVAAREAESQRDQARIESAKALAVKDYLVDLFDSANPEFHQGNEPRVGVMLDRGAEQLRADSAQDPVVRAALLQAIGESYLALSRFDDALPCLELALDLRRRAVSEDPLAVVVTLLVLSDVEEERSQLDRAEGLAREALDLLEEMEGNADVERADAWAQLGVLLGEQGQFEAAERHLRAALELRMRLGGPSDVPVGKIYFAFGEMHSARRDWEPAATSYRRALEILEPTLGEGDPLVLVARHNLATALQDLGDLEGALATYELLLAAQRKLYGDVHAHIVGTLNSIGATHYDLGDFERAEELFRAALSNWRQLNSVETILEARLLTNLGRAIDEQGRTGHAIPLYRETLRILEALDSSKDLGLPLIYLGRALVKTSRAREAESILRRAQRLIAASLGEDHYRVDMARVALGECLTALGQRAEAEQTLRMGYERLHDQLGAEHRHTRRALRALREFEGDDANGD